MQMQHSSTDSSQLPLSLSCGLLSCKLWFMQMVCLVKKSVGEREGGTFFVANEKTSIVVPKYLDELAHNRRKRYCQLLSASQAICNFRELNVKRDLVFFSPHSFRKPCLRLAVCEACHISHCVAFEKKNGAQNLARKIFSSLFAAEMSPCSCQHQHTFAFVVARANTRNLLLFLGIF